MESKNSSQLIIFEQNPENGTYTEFYRYTSRNVRRIDCVTYQNNGYIAITNSVDEDSFDYMIRSPIFRVIGDRIETIQYFQSLNLKMIKLWVHEERFYLVQAFDRVNDEPFPKCPIYRFGKMHFDIVAELQCQNVYNIEKFNILTDMYVAIANYENEYREYS